MTTLGDFKPRSLGGGGHSVFVRESGASEAVTHVLLHGISSGSSSWLRQLQVAENNPDARVLAWDAPGYGLSAPLEHDIPTAHDYATRLWESLEASGRCKGPVTLVGHSLGALMAAAAASQEPDRVSRLVLLAPALGYGADPERGDEVRRNRLGMMQKLGPAGLAQARAAALLSESASSDLLTYVQQIMSQLRPEGYAQAVELLVASDLLALLRKFEVSKLTVAIGEADRVVSLADCHSAAQTLGVRLLPLGPVGHACHLEAASAVNRLLGLTQ